VWGRMGASVLVGVGCALRSRRRVAFVHLRRRWTIPVGSRVARSDGQVFGGLSKTAIRALRQVEADDCKSLSTLVHAASINL
jgi:hypothetical protein